MKAIFSIALTSLFPIRERAKFLRFSQLPVLFKSRRLAVYITREAHITKAKLSISLWLAVHITREAHITKAKLSISLRLAVHITREAHITKAKLSISRITLQESKKDEVKNLVFHNFTYSYCKSL